MAFSPCQGGDNCTQDGTHCQGCGRSHEEIRETKALVGQIVAFAQKMGYDNIDEFTSALAAKASGKYRMDQMQKEGLGGISIS